jgi:capsular polysaccharide biosynthesis protein
MLTVLRRRGWVLLLAIVVATASAYMLAAKRGVTYTAEGTAVVTASPKSLLTPDQAITLAETYAVVIPKDTAILRAVSKALDTTAPQVQKRLSVFNTTGTALLAIDYQGTSAANSIAGVDATLKAIAGSYPVSSNIIPGSVGAVQAPTEASASKAVKVLVAIGAILGIALGLLLMIVWERVDPRIDRPEDLSQEVGSPTSPVTSISTSGVNALVARWKALVEHGPLRIALVPVTADVQADLPKVALRFSQGLLNGKQVQGNGKQVQGNGALPPSWSQIRDHAAFSGDFAEPLANGAPTVIACQVLSADLTELQSIMGCDLVVLVARRGTPRATLRELLDSLTEFGVSPQWAIFLGRSAVTLRDEAEIR